MKSQQQSHWPAQIASFLLTSNAAQALPRFNGALAIAPNPFVHNWFNWRFRDTDSGFPFARLNCSDPALTGVDPVRWFSACRKTGVSPVVVLLEGDAPSDLPDELRSANAMYLARHPDGSWLDDGWLLRYLATPDDLVLDSFQNLRYGLSSDWQSAGLPSGDDFWASYAAGFARWYKYNAGKPVDAGDPFAWNYTLGSFDATLDVSAADCSITANGDGRARIGLRAAPYLQFVLTRDELASYQTGGAHLSGVPGNWIRFAGDIITAPHFSGRAAQRPSIADSLVAQRSRLAAEADGESMRFAVVASFDIDTMPQGSEIGEVTWTKAEARFELFLPSSFAGQTTEVVISEAGLRSNTENVSETALPPKSLHRVHLTIQRSASAPRLIDVDGEMSLVIGGQHFYVKLGRDLSGTDC